MFMNAKEAFCFIKESKEESMHFGSLNRVLNHLLTLQRNYEV